MSIPLQISHRDQLRLKKFHSIREMTPAVPALAHVRSSIILKHQTELQLTHVIGITDTIAPLEHSQCPLVEMDSITSQLTLCCLL